MLHSFIPCPVIYYITSLGRLAFIKQASLSTCIYIYVHSVLYQKELSSYTSIVRKHYPPSLGMCQIFSKHMKQLIM